MLSRLLDQGFKMTQATLSRDLKYLRVSRIHDEEKGYIYILPDNDPPDAITPWSGFLVEGYVSFEFAQNMAIMRTMPGYASSIASAIDSMNMMEIAGTIAGDDTILIIPRDGSKKRDIVQQLAAVIPSLQ